MKNGELEWEQTHEPGFNSSLEESIVNEHSENLFRMKSKLKVDGKF